MADSTAYDGLFEQAGQTHDVDPALLRAIANQESSFNPKAVGPETKHGRAKGLMQLTDGTAAALGVQNPHDPAQAVDGAARLLAQHLDQFGNPADAAAAYFAGPDQANWGPKTRKYQQQVMAAYQQPDLPDALIFGAQPKTAPAKAPAASGDAPADSDVSDALIFGQALPQTPNRHLFVDEPGHITEQVNDAQNTTLEHLADQKALDYNKSAGDKAHPYVSRTDRPAPTRAGDWYIDLDGGLKQVKQDDPWVNSVVAAGIHALPAGNLLANDPREHAFENRFVSGLLLGGKNEATAGLETLPDIVTGKGVGRFGGRLAALDAADFAEHAKFPMVSDAGAVSGALASSVTGDAAVTGAMSAARLGGRLATAPGAVRLGAKVLRGAGEGATYGGVQGYLGTDGTEAQREAAARHGAEFGASLGGAVPVVSAGGRAIGTKMSGANRLIGGAALADQEAAYAAAQGLPVPVPLSKGDITLAPRQQMLENLAAKGSFGDEASQVMRDAAAEKQTALRGNVEAIQTGMAGAPMERGAGAAKVSERLNSLFDSAKAGVDQAYQAARAASDGVSLPASERPVIGQKLTESIKDFDAETIAPVKRIVARFEGSPTTDPVSASDLFDARTKLGVIRVGSNRDQAVAAGHATQALDGYIDDALKADLLHGNNDVINAWRKAIGKRREMGKLFEGNDLIADLTRRTSRGGERVLAVAPEDAANFIFNKDNLGFVGKKNLNRDLTRLRGVLGPDSDEWGALRAEAFGRIARAGEGSPEGGVPQFSGQNFMKAWEKAKAENPHILNTLFSADERKTIDQFATTAQRATTAVRGGDNPSNSSVGVKALMDKFMGSLPSIAGGAVGGLAGHALGGGVHAAEGAGAGVAAGRVFDAFINDLKFKQAAEDAKKSVSGRPAAPPKVPQQQNRLVGGSVPLLTMGANRITGAPSAAAP